MTPSSHRTHTHRKLFIGRVLSVTQTTVIMTAAAELGPLPESAISLQAGAVVLEQARGLIGRIVRYTAEVSEQTQCLTKPKFVIGSEMGLQAVTVHGAPEVAVERATRSAMGVTVPAGGEVRWDEGEARARDFTDLGTAS